MEQNHSLVSDSSSSNEDEGNEDDNSSLLLNGSSHDARDVKHATSDLQTFTHLVKANIGSGILALPFAVSNAGVLVGPIGIGVFAVIVVHCMHLLVRSSRVWCKRKKRSFMSYGDVAEECVASYFPKKGRIARLTINTFLVVSQLGFCCTYLIFVGKNLQQVFSSSTSFDVDIKVWIVMVLPFFIVLSFVKNLDTLSWISFVSIILLFSGYISIFYYLATNLNDPMDLPYFAGIQTFPVFSGVVIYTFEGIGLILPLENKMRNPSNFDWLLNISMTLVVTAYILIGFLGYLMCTDDCKGSITLNLGEQAFAVVVKCVLTLGIFLTYFLEMYVPMDLLEPWFLRHVDKGDRILRSFCFRTAMVLFTAILAIVIPQLGNFISLVGSTSCSALALVFPAIFHSISCPESSKIIHMKNIAISLLGIAAAVLGTALTVHRIVESYEY